jgi:hypothetical protein
VKAGYIFRAGDVVHHVPTGEEWVVAYVDGKYLAWCGWPDGVAQTSDCRLKTSCTDDEHLRLFHDISQSAGKRARMARLELERLAPSVRSQRSGS